MNWKSIVFLVLVVLCVFALRNRSKPTADSQQEVEEESVEVAQPLQLPPPPKTLPKVQSPPRPTEQALPSPSPTESPKVAQASSAPATSQAPSPKVSMNQKFFERYQKVDIMERLQQSQLLKIGSKVSTSLSSLSVYTIKTQAREVKVYSSFDSSSEGCISIGENKPIQGSTANSSVEIFQLPEGHAYAIIVQKQALVVIYADVGKWGQRSGDEEPRLMLYYRKNAQGKWVLLGKGDDSAPYDPDQYRAQMQFCDYPQHRR